MGFIDELRDLLREVSRAGRLPTTGTARADLPPELRSAGRRELARLLAEVERRFPAAVAGATHGLWSKPDALETFLGAAVEALTRGPVCGDDTPRVHRLAIECLRKKLSGEPGSLGLMDRLEVDRAWSIANAALLGWSDEGPDVVRYAVELGLLRERAGQVTRAGETLLDLIGPEAVEWLILLEMERSLGPDDPWRLCRETATELYRRRSCHAPEDEWWSGVRSGELFESGPSEARLVALDLLAVSDTAEHDDLVGWRLTSLGARVLGSALSDPPSPLGLLARAVASDDLHAITGLPRSGSSAQHQQLEYTRMVAHELRNAIGPTRAAFQHLIQRPDLTSEQREPLIARVRRGLDRLEEFGDKAARVVDVGARPTRVPVAEAVEAAIRATADERNGRVRVERRLIDDLVWGDRERLTLVFVNLLRNAAQQGSALSRVEISMTRAGDEIELLFSDDGPGVPPHAAGQIFDPGFSLRGGTGYGLYMVRHVVEQELAGRVSYRANERGGACFVLTLPALAGGDR